MWVLTVASESTSSSAISAFDRPCAARRELSFSLGQGGVLGAGLDAPGGAEALEERSGGAGGDHAISGCDGPDGGEEELGLGALEDERAGAGLDRLGRGLVEIERGQDQNLRGGLDEGVDDVRGGPDTVDLRHPNIYHHHVRARRFTRSTASVPSPAWPTTARSG